MEAPSCVIEESPLRCRAMAGCIQEGKTGYLLGAIDPGRWWAIVIWDEEEAPSFFKADWIEVESFKPYKP